MEDVVQGRGRRASRAQYVHRVVHAATRRQQSGNVVDGVKLSFTMSPSTRRLVTRSMPVGQVCVYYCILSGCVGLQLCLAFE